MTAEVPVARPDDVASYVAAGWWGERTVGDVVRDRARAAGAGMAFVDDLGDRMSWATYDAVADRFAEALLDTGLPRGARVAVILPDGPLLHAAFVGAGRAGLVVVGIGHRAGRAEVEHLVGATGARAAITAGGVELPPMENHLVVRGASGDFVLDAGPARRRRTAADRRPIGPSELFLLNSTSGTTGLPKCVMQTENRWFFFHRKAVEFGQLRPEDVFLSAVPGPFGFGLWTAHFTPTLLGAPCVVMGRFSADRLLELVESERVTVLACVSTQFIMALDSPALERCDTSSLRVLFTGGERIPYERAAEFEDRTGATLLNFYGSNETGMLSGTRVTDDREHRLRTAGRCVAEMQVRLFDDDRRPLPSSATRGVPGCRGPATALGYYDDAEANASLYTDDGWMLMGDVIDVDVDGWLTVVGRTSDFIIRGGKNLSAAAIEAEVETHPLVRLAAVVPVPDPTFGERVAVYVELEPGATLALDELRRHLLERGVSKEWIPELVVVVDELPRSSGGKVAKGALRADARERTIPA